MSWAVAARVLGAVLPLPLGGAAARLALGLALAGWLSAHSPPPPAFAVGPALTELALGLSLGLLAALPAHAGQALAGDAAPALGRLGQTLAWAVFFALAGPALWALGLAHSLAAIPPAAWPDAAALSAAGGAYFAAALALGLPCWIPSLAVGPLAGWISRVGQPGAGQALLSLRPALVLITWIALLPFAIDWLGALWRAALRG